MFGMLSLPIYNTHCAQILFWKDGLVNQQLISIVDQKWRLRHTVTLRCLHTCWKSTNNIFPSTAQAASVSQSISVTTAVGFHTYFKARGVGSENCHAKKKGETGIGKNTTLACEVTQEALI